ncbi:MAG: hypothetical protein ACK6DC_21290 [Planctomycetota bacterium]
MEMQVDDEWPLNVLIMAPPHLVVSLTSEADVVSMGMIPGASYTPGDGDYSQISENGGQWVLARPSDDLQKIVRNGLGVLLVIDSADDIDSISNFRGLSSENMIVAFPIDSVSTLTTATQMLTEIQTKFAAKQISARILISGSFAHKDLTDYMTIDGASGLLLLDASSDSILELIHNILG